MKQNISVLQLEELSKRGKKKLRKWWKPKIGDWFCDDPEIIRGLADPRPTLCSKIEKGNLIVAGYDALWEEGKKDKLFPLLSIGQMIEYLDENNGGWINAIEKDAYIGGVHEEEVEYCDSLWKVVKEILEE